MNRGIGLVIAAALLCARPAAAQSVEEVKIETVELGGGLAMLLGQGGNLGVSTGPDGVFLVDDQYAPLTPRILGALEKLGAGPPRFVLNTHWHGDHTGGNENLGKAGALIVAHDAVRERMSTEQFMQAFARRVPPAPPAALPVLTFGEDLTFHLNGQQIHVFHVGSAHTDGDAVVHFRSANLIHAGDVLFNGIYPFIDLSSGGSLDGVIAAAESVLSLCDQQTRIIPGHGPLAGRDDLLAYREMLVAVRGRVRALLDQGSTLEQVLAARPTADYDAEWGDGFLKPEQFVKILYASLSGPSQ